MENNQSSYTSWTWIVAFLLALVLLWMLITGRGPSAACCHESSATVTETAPEDAPPAQKESFSFSATDSNFTNRGDTSNISWINDSEALKAILSTGIIAEGDETLVVLSGSVNSEEEKAQKGLDAQTFFGPDITIDNQIMVIEPEPMVESAQAVADPVTTPDKAKIYFDSGVHRLPIDGTAALEPIATWLNDNTEHTVAISGFHDPTGDYASNQRLAKKRAESVYNALVQLGISTDRIEMRKPEVTEGDGNLAEARRVEVSIE